MVKLLLCGQVDGAWPLVWERARKLHAAAPYDALVCVGRAFPFPSDASSAPLPTYFLAAHETLSQWTHDATQAPLVAKLRAALDSDASDPVELLPNVFALGRQGVATIAGLKIAFLAGSQGAGNDEPTYSKATVDALREALDKHGSEDVDFLFTADYAAHFDHLVPELQVPEPLKTIQTSSPLASLLKQFAPRYHITSAARASDGGVFYQRLPYVTESSATGRKQLTRLIGLCGVNSTKDKTKKYLHALQVVPSAQQQGDQLDIPAGTTQNPFVQYEIQQQQQQQRAYEPAAKRQRVEAPRPGGGGLSAEQIAELTAKGNNGGQFFYDQKIAARGQHPGALRPQDHHHQRHRAPPVPERTECWFCLATPSVERHLIASIGQEAYLAMPKGAINEDHVLIVPIAHEASTTKLSASTLQEVERFKTALREYFAAKDKEMIVFDRNILTVGATHCHLQVVGVPRAKAAIAHQVFLREGEKYNVKFQELKPEDDVKSLTDGKPYFYAEVPDGQGGIVRLLNFVEAKQYMQFGRHATACVLGVPRRANWKFCVVPKHEEEALTKQFKANWKPYDFTLTLDDE